MMMTNNKNVKLNKNVNHHKMVADEWEKFAESTGFCQQKSINETTLNDVLNNYNDQSLKTINEAQNLCIELNKLFDDNITKIIRESNLEFDENQIPTLQQLIENQKQTCDRFSQLNSTLDEIIDQRNSLCDEFKSLQIEIDNFRKHRDQLVQKIDETQNKIEKESSKICFRKHNDQLVVLVFNNSDGRLQNLFEIKENSTKEDFWQDLHRKILN
ncbi:LOW QUALITY PROTEIN: uncharacterized protein LOC113793160 [Dermatophagoides pteronyssinus]|uniref:LOW QUALITY PROTEIN: uncharacterized protein LOC113793160 n=1 Tax=Dermatophagoides pteronyssinus TaxID=6956 RepID=UPI003F66DA79